MSPTYAFIPIALAVVAMVLFIVLNGRRKNTMSREHAEREGLHGEEGLRAAEKRRSGE